MAQQGATGDARRHRVERAADPGEAWLRLVPGARQLHIGALLLQLRLAQVELGVVRQDLGANPFHRGDAAGLDPSVGGLQRAPGQVQEGLRQAHPLLRGQRRVVGAADLGAQFGATDFQLGPGDLAAAFRHLHPRTALAAQLQRLGDADAGLAIALAGVLDAPGQIRVGDQPGLLPRAAGDLGLAPHRRQLGVAPQGPLQRLLEADRSTVETHRRLVRQGRQAQAESHQ